MGEWWQSFSVSSQIQLEEEQRRREDILEGRRARIVPVRHIPTVYRYTDTQTHTKGLFYSSSLLYKIEQGRRDDTIEEGGSARTVQGCAGTACLHTYTHKLSIIFYHLSFIYIIRIETDRRNYIREGERAPTAKGYSDAASHRCPLPLKRKH